ncbi:MAG: hypothetical protein AAFQ83_02860 [Bacteroidota bacterium]
MKQFLIFTIVLLAFIPLSAQVDIRWQDLERVSFSASESDGTMGLVVEPDFSASLKALDGKKVRIKGFMLPLTVDNELYILSRYHFSNCFFCGGAGKETVIHLEPKESDLSFELDESVIVTGIFRLVDDPQELCFKIEKARIDPE